MGCIRCGSPMAIVEDKVVCTNDACGYQYEITIFNEDDLTKENKRLKSLIRRCTKYIQDAIEWCEHDDDIIVKSGKALLKDILSGKDNEQTIVHLINWLLAHNCDQSQSSLILSLEDWQLVRKLIPEKP